MYINICIAVTSKHEFEVSEQLVACIPYQVATENVWSLDCYLSHRICMTRPQLLNAHCVVVELLLCRV